MTINKKILILGGNYVEIEIVKRAKLLGYYTIITDNHEDWSLSPAKLVADEGWNISWSDIDALEQKCKDVKVDGVLAGFSEFRIEAMIKLCERLNFPCSLTMQQLEITRNKFLFKATCRKYGVPTVPEYSIDKVSSFPVIIKPVDRAGSIGINVAYDKKELEKHYQYALSLSPSKSVVIEDFITDGIKFDVYYYVQNGRAYFIGSSDTIMCKGENGAKILQKCWPFRSKFENVYRRTVEPEIKRMFEGLGIRNTYVTMSAFYKNGQFYFFEAGFRLSGEMSFDYQEAISGVNYIDTILKFSTKESDDTVYSDVDGRNKHSVILNFFVVDGEVDRVKGFDIINNLSDVYCARLYLNEGDVITNSTNVFKKGAMITIIADTHESLVNTIIEVNDCFDIIGVNGQSLIYERVTEKELTEYYKM